jgi:hypothetical protein
VFGLAKVQRLTCPDDLAGLTAVFQAFCHIGFAAPYLLSMLCASATVLLLGVAALAASTLTLTVWQARRTAAHSLNPLERRAERHRGRRSCARGGPHASGPDARKRRCGIRRSRFLTRVDPGGVML